VLDDADVRLAVHLGVLVAEGSVDDVLAAVVAHTGADLAQLDAWDGRTAAALAVHGCPPEVSRVLSVDLLADGVFGRRLLGSGTVWLADDPPEPFRRSPHYTGCFAPAGVAAGASTALRTGSGRTTGLVHLASTRPGHFTEWHRTLLGVLAPVLARAAEPPPPTALLPPGWAVSRVRHGRALPVEGRAPAAVVDDHRLRELARRFADHDVPHLHLHWPWAGRWHEVRFLRGAGAGAAVVVGARPVPLPSGLTPRELEVLTALTTGATNQQIASALVVTPRTVATHVENLLEKLDVPSRAAAAVAAVRSGAVWPSEDPRSPRSVDLLLGAGRFR
jgi:DNA-binding CsgD family transcriptional regulator